MVASISLWMGPELGLRWVLLSADELETNSEQQGHSMAQLWAPQLAKHYQDSDWKFHLETPLEMVPQYLMVIELG